MKVFTVRHDGYPIATFDTQDKARDFLLKYMETQMLATQQLDYLDEAVLQSNMDESKMVLKHVMKKR